MNSGIFPGEWGKALICTLHKECGDTARDAIPGVAHKDCAFHFAQALFRKVEALGLQPGYTSDIGSFELLKKFMALCFLPVQHIELVFRRLQTDCIVTVCGLYGQNIYLMYSEHLASSIMERLPDQHPY
ncbi:hypothetical protein LSH36_39g16043 [Paralvinella palmiformis]|uniref:Uncharacterized protein n=1 Tax=Paralvinella palmiformis TaxID=53620 RepID=A0AAD9K8J1_9ANNE|nr:hypothetical protein LSH36_39g16043 [Paralvinella palmiformis]